MLILHLFIALASVIASTVTYIVPSRAKLGVSFGLIGATLASGTYLVVSTRAHMLQACVSGLAYTGVSLVVMVAARHRLAAISVDRQEK